LPGVVMNYGVTFQDIQVARHALAGMGIATPLESAKTLSKDVGAKVYLKREDRHPTGAFKFRGASYFLSKLSEEEKARGVVTFSTGNHGRAVAHIARSLNVRCVVCMSKHVPLSKVAGIKSLGAEVRLVGETQDDAFEEALRLTRDGLVIVPAFDHPWIIAGQGTIGLELLEALPDLETVLVPLSGGGLLAGVTLALKAVKPDIHVVGISVEACPAMINSIRAGNPITVEESETLADCLLGGIGLDNQYTFPIIRDLVDELIIVGEQEIMDGMRYLYHQEGLALEGASAVTVGALLHERVKKVGRTTACVLTGKNIDPQRFAEVVGISLEEAGRQLL
jgi:threonine dehydratase